jgi:hypothetical protein
MDFSQENKMNRSPSPFMKELSQSPTHLGIINEENETSVNLKYPNRWTEANNLSKFHLSLKKERSDNRSDRASIFSSPSSKCHINNKKYLDVIKEMI